MSKKWSWLVYFSRQRRKKKDYRIKKFDSEICRIHCIAQFSCRIPRANTAVQKN